VVIQRVPDWSVKIAFADAPFGRYGRYKENQHNKDGAAINGCDNLQTEKVVELIDDLMRLMIDKIASDGVMLVCSPKTDPGIMRG